MCSSVVARQADEGQTSAMTQPTTDAAGPPALDRELTADAAQAELSRIESDSALPEDEKSVLVDAYKQIIVQTQLAADWKSKQSELETTARRALEQLESVRARVQALTSQPASQPSSQPASAAARPDAERELAAAQADLAAAKLAANRFADQMTLRADRRKAIPDLLRKVRELTTVVSTELDAPTPAHEPASVTLAKRKLLLARRATATAEALFLEAELREFDTIQEFSGLRRDEELQRARRAEQRVEAWQRAVNEARRIESERQAEEVRKEAEAAPRAVADLAGRNAELARKRSELTEKLAAAQREYDELKAQFGELEARFNTMKDKVRVADTTPGLYAAIEPLMRLARAQLPDQRLLSARARSLQEAIGQATLDSLEFGEQLSELRSRFDAVVHRHAAALGATLSDAQKAAGEESIRRLLSTQRELLEGIRNDLTTYTSRLFDAGRKCEELNTQASEMARYIDEKVLWIRSADALYKTSFPTDAGVLLEVWRRASDALTDDIVAVPAIYIGAGVLFALAMGVRVRALRVLVDFGRRATGIYSDSFALTLKAIAMTLFVATPWPALIAFLGWRASLGSAQDVVVSGVALAAYFFAVPFYVLESLRTFALPGGVAEKHFLWRSDACRSLRRGALLLMVFALPAAPIVNITEPMLGTQWRDSVARVAFMVAMLAMSVFAHMVARPGGVLLGPLLAREQAWLYRSRYLLYFVLVVAPVALAVAAAMGYFYTAVQLNRRILLTVLLAAVVIGLHTLILRWLFVEQRRLAIAQFRKLRAAREQAREAGDPQTEPTDQDESAIDLGRIDMQTRRLVNSGAVFAVVIGIFLIWLDMMPAFRFLTRHQVWSHVVQELDGSGVGAATMKTVAVTYADLAVAMIIASATLILGRNIPGLLEIAILQRLPLEPAGRYAVTSVSRYVITAVGSIAVLGVLGVQWSDVQWLAAAVTVGLGFGLQEIFANFVSGLIILFERPVRVGDIVTVGDVTGTVSRIRIRATTIVDWNRKELIVPNREFITGRVVNWTLTDSSLRIVIPVGVAYGSDTNLVRRLLLKIAERNENILKEPRPMALFVRFGTSTLDFELRVFVGHPEVMSIVIDALHAEIDREFRAAGVEIAFQQVSVHIQPPASLSLEASPSRATASK